MRPSLQLLNGGGDPSEAVCELCTWGLFLDGDAVHNADTGVLIVAALAEMRAAGQKQVQLCTDHREDAQQLGVKLSADLLHPVGLTRNQRRGLKVAQTRAHKRLVKLARQKSTPAAKPPEGGGGGVEF